MSKDGVLLLKEVVVSFCKWGGSSKGVRELADSTVYKSFIQNNPHIQIAFAPRHGKHPNVKGIWVNGAEKVLCVKNQTPVEIVKQLEELRRQSGLKLRRLTQRVITEKPTIQGFWNPYLDLANKLVEAPAKPSTQNTVNPHT